MTAESDATPRPADEPKPTTADLAAAGPEAGGTPRPEGPPRAAESRSFARDDASAGAAKLADGDERVAPLLPGDEATDLTERWRGIQVGFVDEPRKAVEDADSLVAQAMKRLAEMFADERAKLEGQWDRGGDVSTEELRVALRRYRAFFSRLLAV